MLGVLRLNRATALIEDHVHTAANHRFPLPYSEKKIEKGFVYLTMAAFIAVTTGGHFMFCISADPTAM